eukprot:CAMPEP_0181288152 /NCGR_PEP_ID=MMETSP1101-20121128/175_1 /TAXON_ID=46948 /ORGANISM="Rhodomonas abbreviata, Strain Caron Lab Isolate" /LENGTH=1090 /DNA_ID=CAMNT_0023392245 /DNA_START=88 /DNA_END=3357 /DNA_ORIENTATION=-
MSRRAWSSPGRRLVSSAALFLCNIIICRAACGDNVLEVGEICDDGNLENGDGCSDVCREECGFKCIFEGDQNSANQTNATQTPVFGRSVCSTTCGDGVLAATESCDDGNKENGDGCDDSCSPETLLWTCQNPMCEISDCTAKSPWMVLERQPCVNGCTAGIPFTVRLQVYGAGVTDPNLRTVLICGGASGGSCQQNWLVGEKAVAMSPTGDGGGEWEAKAPSDYWTLMITNAADSYILRFDINEVSLKTAVFEVVADSPEALIIERQPPSMVLAQRVLVEGPSVSVKDRFGNSVGGDTVTCTPISVDPSFEMAEDPTVPLLEGRVSIVSSPSSSVAFRDLSFSLPGNFTLEFKGTKNSEVSVRSTVIHVQNFESKPEILFLIEDTFTSWESEKGNELTKTLAEVCEIDEFFFSLTDVVMYRNDSFLIATVSLSIQPSVRRRVSLSAIENAIRTDFSTPSSSLLINRMEVIGIQLAEGRPIGVAFSVNPEPIGEANPLHIDVDGAAIAISVMTGFGVAVSGITSMGLNIATGEQKARVAKFAFTRYGFCAALNLAYETQYFSLLGQVGGPEAQVADFQELSNKLQWVNFDWSLIPRELLTDDSEEKCNKTTGNMMLHRFATCISVLGMTFLFREILLRAIMSGTRSRPPELLMFPNFEGPTILVITLGLFHAAARTCAVGCLGWTMVSILLGFMGPLSLIVVAMLKVRANNSYRYLVSGDQHATLASVVSLAGDKKDRKSYISSVVGGAGGLYHWLIRHDINPSRNEAVDPEDKPLKQFGFLFKDLCKRGWAYSIIWVCLQLGLALALVISRSEPSAIATLVVHILHTLFMALIRPFSDPFRNFFCVLLSLFRLLSIVCATVAFAATKPDRIYSASKAALILGLITWALAFLDTLISSFRSIKCYYHWTFDVEEEAAAESDIVEAAVHNRRKQQQQQERDDKMDDASVAPSRQLDGFSLSSDGGGGPHSNPSSSPRFHPNASGGSPLGNGEPATRTAQQYLYRGMQTLQREYNYQPAHETVRRANYMTTSQLLPPSLPTPTALQASTLQASQQQALVAGLPSSSSDRLYKTVDDDHPRPPAPSSQPALPLS